MLRRWLQGSERDAPLGDAPGDEAASGLDDGTPRTLGGRLREHRLASGFTLEQAAEETRISYGYLDAIEADRFDVLPAPVYVRGFVRLYARFLGIDPEDAVEQLPDDLPQPPGLEPLPGLRLREGLGVLPAVSRRWVVLAAAAAIVLVAAFVFGVPGVGLGTGDDSEGGDAAATASPTAEATGTPLADSMPDLIGRERAEAERLVRDLGATFVVIEVGNPSGDVEPGRVFAHIPEAGEVLAAGQSVTLFVAKQPAASGE